MLGQPGKVGQQARVLEHPAAERVDDGHAAEAGRLDEAGHPELGVGAQLERVAEPGVGPAQDHVDTLEPTERAHPHPAVAHRQVGALDQRVAEVGSQVGVLEGGLAPRAGAEQHDPGIVGVGRGDVLERGPQRAEEGGEPVDLGVAVQAREHPGDDDPVLQGVARARRRLGAVGQHGAAARGVAGEVDGHSEQLLAAGHADLVALAQEAGVAEDQLGGQQPAAQQLAGAVEIGEDQVEQLGPLDHAELDAGPLVAGEQHRDRVEGPGSGRRGRGVAGIVLAVDVVGDAVVVEQAAGLGATVEQLVEAQIADDVPGVRPVLADPPVGA